MSETTQHPPAVFIDRDGTLIEEVGYLKSPAQIRLVPGAHLAIQIFRSAGYRIMVVSNQSGVARGLFTEEHVRRVHNALAEKLAELNAPVDDFYYCPHLPDAPVPEYRKQCTCRKPGPGMLYKARADHQIDLKNSIMIGDKLSDVEAGKRAGTRTVLVLTGYGKSESEKLSALPQNQQPDIIAGNLLEAAHQISKRLHNTPT